ncbi:MAG: rod shape-determining protein MreD [Pseudomonadota bacterium]
MRSILFFLLAGSGCLVIQCGILHRIFPMELKPDLTLLVVVWVGLKGDYLSGLFAAFLIGLTQDLLSGSPLGLFSVMYVLTIIFAGYLSDNFHVESLGASFAIAFLISLGSFSLVFISRWLLGQVTLELEIVKIILVKTILTSLSLIIVKPVLDNAWKGYSRIVGAI